MYRLGRTRVTLALAALGSGLLLWSSLDGVAVASSKGAAVPRAEGGCGTVAPATIGPTGVYVGVTAAAKPGVTGKQVMASIPSDTVARWCSRVVFVDTLKKAGPVTIKVQFLSRASKGDVTRAAAYFRDTELFSRIVVVAHPEHY